MSERIKHEVGCSGCFLWGAVILAAIFLAVAVAGLLTGA